MTKKNGQSAFATAQAQADIDEAFAKAEAAEHLAAELEDEVKIQEKAIAQLERELGVLSRLGARRGGPPAWLKSTKRSAKKNWGTPWLMLSDLHLDEVVNVHEVMGMNKYNRRIAEMRLDNVFENTVKIAHSWGNTDFHGIVCCMIGDIFSGAIHDELKITNEDDILASLDYWHDPIARGFGLLLQEFPKVHVPVVVGNHGRTTRRPTAKFRARSNFDWYLGRSLQRLFADEKRITFDVSESPDLIVSSYDKEVLLTHGDQARGGSGIAGIYSPIMRLNARKRQKHQNVQMPFDYMLMGHWHQLLYGSDWVINGSLKGYDEYAFTENFGFEPPQQGMFLMEPNHGMVQMTGVRCQDAEAEGWADERARFAK